MKVFVPGYTAGKGENQDSHPTPPNAKSSAATCLLKDTSVPVTQDR